MPGIYVGGHRTDYSAMQGPAPDGFHVPLTTEWQAVYNIWTALGGGSNDGANFGIALKMSFAGYRNYETATAYDQGVFGNYWSSSRSNENQAYSRLFNASAILPQYNYNRAYGFSVRCFKNSPTVPTSSWTKLYGTSIESGGIFWSSADGLISLSSDGSTWITIQDKNLGATQVWNSGDTVSEANCGKYYQRGNNYGFAWTGSLTTSSTQVNASTYGPGNYYSSSTFITRSSSPYRWDSTDNGNLRGGVTGIVEKTGEIKNVYVGTTPVKEIFVGTTKVRPTGWQPGANTIAYYKFDGNLNDSSGNNRNLSMYTGSFSYSTLSSGQPYCQLNTSAQAYFYSLPFSRTAYTVSGWCYFTDVYGTPQHIIMDLVSGSDYFPRFYAGGYNHSGKISSVVSFDSYGITGQNNKWYHLVTVYNNRVFSSYINGQFIHSETYNTSENSGTLYINGTSNYKASYRTAGKISELILENKARTAQEISDYYNSTKSKYGL